MKFDEFKIKQICDQYGIKNYTIDNGLVNVNGNVDLSHRQLTKISVSFGTVTGDFICSGNALTTLIGSPNTVGGRFDCSVNNLTDLTGSPNTVNGYFICSHNDQLTSLEGVSDLIGSKFICHYTPIYSIFQSNDPGLINMFNAIFIDSVDMEKIKYWFSINNKPLTDEILEKIKQYYPL